MSTLAPMWAATDAARLPNEAWAKAGRDERVRVVLPPVATLLCGVGGLLVAWKYHRHVRPRVLAHRQPSEPRSF